MAGVDLAGLGPAPGHAELSHRAEVAHRVEDPRVVEEGAGRAGFDRPPGQVGVLAAGNREALLVEAPDTLDQVARVEDVAGLEVVAGARHLKRPRERPETAERGAARRGP